MKNIIVCIMGILMCSSCHDTDNYVSGDSDDTMKRRDEISKIMKDHYHNDSFDYGFEIRGPFTIKQFKEEYVKHYEELFDISELKPRTSQEIYDRMKKFMDSQEFKDFVRLNGKGNELYFFRSDMRSRSDLYGVEGYVIIHKNKIIDIMITAIS